MKRLSHGLLAWLLASIGHFASAVDYQDARLEQEGSALRIVESNGSSFTAPKIGAQDSFDKPGVAPNRGHVGWLALEPDHGASYSLPIGLFVLGADRRLHEFYGRFGMVFDWCFVGNDAVVFRYGFAHGATSDGFDMRRIDDEKLLRRAVVAPRRARRGAPESEPKAPPWAACTR